MRKRNSKDHNTHKDMHGEVASRGHQKPDAAVAGEVRRRSKGFVGKGQIAAQTANVASSDFGDSAKLIERGVALAPLNPANVARSGIRLQRQIFLGQPFGLPRCSDPLAKHLERCRFSQP